MSDRFNGEFLADIAKLYKKYDVDALDISNALLNEIKKNSKQRTIDKSKENLDLVGRCFRKIIKPSMFPEMNRYCKVLSIQSNSEYRVECLCFDEHPTYWFSYQSSQIKNAGDYYLGRFEFESFEVEDKMASYIREEYEEISLEEYNQAAKKYTEELINLPWYAEHYRFGGKLPTDPDWPEKEKN